MQNSEFRTQKALLSTRWIRVAMCLHSAFCILNYSLPVHAQQLIDRVLARVGTHAVTMTDLRIAVEVGLVEIPPGQDRQAASLQATIDRQLLLDEVARFSPPEPAPAAVATEVATMKARAGAGLDALTAGTGLDEARLQQLARETLRIRAYIAQRFAASSQVTEDEARKYYEEHAGEFTRDGARRSFEEAEGDVRSRAAAERLRTIVDQWTRDLRMRADVVIVGGSGR
jgi:hypothetical protein